MNNAFYGKTLENVRNRQDIKIVNCKEKAMYHAAKIGFTKSTIFSEFVEAIHFKKSTITFDKFNYIGSTILELSKLVMYEFIYDTIDVAYSGNYKIHGGDTDSIFVELYENNLDKIKDRIHDNKLGYFSNELPQNKIISKYIILKSKMYYLKAIDIYDKSKIWEKMALKGLTIPSTKYITGDNFSECIQGIPQPKVTSYKLISKKHIINLSKQEKDSLNRYDDKRYIMPDAIHTLPYGHYQIIE